VTPLEASGGVGPPLYRCSWRRRTLSGPPYRRFDPPPSPRQSQQPSVRATFPPRRLHPRRPGHAVTPQEFIAKWTTSVLKERSGSQEHFIDLCRLLGEKTPAEAAPPAPSTPSRRAPRSTAAATAGPTCGSEPLRLGVQGQAQGAGRRLRPAPEVPRVPGEPSPPRRLRHGKVRGPHELHRHGSSPASASRRSPRRPPVGSPPWCRGCGSGGWTPARPRTF